MRCLLSLSFLQTVSSGYHILPTQGDVIDGSPSPSLQLLDLDDWSMMDILDFMSFEDLVILCNVSPELRQLITEHYMPKYHIDTKTIHLRSTSLSSSVFETIIHIENPQIAELFLRNFGHSITVIKLNEVIERNAEIREYIIKYCANTLIELSLCSPDGYFLYETATTFPALTKLTLSYPGQTDIYPEFNRIYPALKELSFTPSVLFTRANERYLYEMLQKTPKLRALSIGRVPSFLALQIINEIQPNIEELSIDYFVDIFRYLQHNETIHFNNVKSLYVNIEDKYDSMSDRFPMRFNQLERLEIRMTHIENAPVDMIKDAVGLKSLSLPKWSEMSDLLSILDRVNPTNAIEDVSIRWTSANGLIHNTNRLMNDFPALRRISFAVCDGLNSTTNHDSLIGLITNPWRVVGNKGINNDETLERVTIERNGSS